MGGVWEKKGGILQYCFGKGGMERDEWVFICSDSTHRVNMDHIMDQSGNESTTITDTEYFSYIQYIDPMEDTPGKRVMDVEEYYWERVEEIGLVEYGTDWLINHWDSIVDNSD